MCVYIQNLFFLKFLFAMICMYTCIIVVVFYLVCRCCQGEGKVLCTRGCFDVELCHFAFYALVHYRASGEGGGEERCSA